MIKPTVGRKVWFIPTNQTAVDYALCMLADTELTTDEETVWQPLDATIVGVHTDTEVNLFVVDTDGNVYGFNNIQLKQDDDDVDETEDYAMWMPYQVTQAAKNASPGAILQPSTGINQ